MFFYTRAVTVTYFLFTSSFHWRDFGFFFPLRASFTLCVCIECVYLLRPSQMKLHRKIGLSWCLNSVDTKTKRKMVWRDDKHSFLTELFTKYTLAQSLKLTSTHEKITIKEEEEKTQRKSLKGCIKANGFGFDVFIVCVRSLCQCNVFHSLLKFLLNHIEKGRWNKKKYILKHKIRTSGCRSLNFLCIFDVSFYSLAFQAEQKALSGSSLIIWLYDVFARSCVSVRMRVFFL